MSWACKLYLQYRKIHLQLPSHKISKADKIVINCVSRFPHPSIRMPYFIIYYLIVGVYYARTVLRTSETPMKLGQTLASSVLKYSTSIIFGQKKRETFTDKL